MFSFIGACHISWSKIPIYDLYMLHMNKKPGCAALAHHIPFFCMFNKSAHQPPSNAQPPLNCFQSGNQISLTMFKGVLSHFGITILSDDD